MLKIWLPIIALATWLCLPIGPAQATLTQCPAGTIEGVGFTGCNVLFTANADGTFSTTEDTSQGVFPDFDDQYVGFQNSSSNPISAIVIDGGPISLFAFDADGPNSNGNSAQFCPSAGSGQTGYEGPDNTFSHINTSGGCTMGEVDFIAAIAPGQSTYFFLEELLDPRSPQPVISLPPQPNPEPGSLAILSAALLALRFGRNGWRHAFTPSALAR